MLIPIGGEDMMNEKFDIGKLNSRLATLTIIIASLGIVAIFIQNIRWLKANYYEFTELVAIFAWLALLLMPFLFVGWVFSWILGRRKKDVDHTQLSIKKGVVTIILFFAFFVALNIESGNGMVGGVYAKDDLKMYDQGGHYYVQLVGMGITYEDESITLELNKVQYKEISNFKETVLIEYSYNSKIPNRYHFELAKSNETEHI
jgi:hypothetical protein